MVFMDPFGRHARLIHYSPPPPKYITTHSGDSFMLWDSGYTPQLRRSYLLGMLDNMFMLEQSPHLVIDGTFKTAPNSLLDGESLLHLDSSLESTLFEYSRGMEQRFCFTCQLPKSNYMELSRMRQDRQHFVSDFIILI